MRKLIIMMAVVTAAISCNRTEIVYEDAVLFRNTETDTIPYFRVTDKPSAYSTMIPLDDGSVAFYYEESPDPWPRGYDMVFRVLDLKDITDGKYTPINRPIWKR